jgi:hypothetical protein
MWLVNPHAPTFPPTAIDYYNYPWRDPSNYDNLKNNQNDKDGLDQNGFSYLITTQKKEPPEARLLEYSAPFVNKTHGAVFCMNRDLFWGSWMLKRLQNLVRGTELIPQEVYLEDATAQYPKYSFTVLTRPTFEFGTNPDHANAEDSYFELTDNGSGWSWSKSVSSRVVSINVPSDNNSTRTVAQSGKVSPNMIQPKFQQKRLTNYSAIRLAGQFCFWWPESCHYGLQLVQVPLYF